MGQHHTKYAQKREDGVRVHTHAGGGVGGGLEASARDAAWVIVRSQHNFFVYFFYFSEKWEY